MKKTALVLLCLLAVCLLLTACQGGSDRDDAERARSITSISEQETSLTTADETIAAETTVYQLLHGACPSGLNGRIETYDDTLSAKTWYLGSFGASDQPLPDAFASLSFDQDTTEEVYLSAFRSALSKTLPEGNLPERFSVSVKSELIFDEGVGKGYHHFVFGKEVEDAIKVTYTFRFFVAVAGLESNASIVIKVENYQIKSVELYDLSRFLRYQDFTVDIAPMTAFAEEAVRDEWKAMIEADGESVRYGFNTDYTLAVSDDALYLRIRTSVLRVIGFCGRGFGYCIHYIKLS